MRNPAYTEAVLYMGNYFIHPNRLMIDDLEDLSNRKDSMISDSVILISPQIKTLQREKGLHSR